ncbi:hypothetical protein GCM10012319_26320 [Comamonas sp. KCTC 72670]|nr:hypothetical protein GCM10012319_26320 [Comamonas sp. KCTC 72670]
MSGAPGAGHVGGGTTAAGSEAQAGPPIKRSPKPSNEEVFGIAREAPGKGASPPSLARAWAPREAHGAPAPQRQRAGSPGGNLPASLPMGRKAVR